MSGDSCEGGSASIAPGHLVSPIADGASGAAERHVVAVITDSLEGLSRHLIDAVRVRLAERGCGVLCIAVCDPSLSEMSTDRERRAALERTACRFGHLRATILLSGVLGNRFSVRELTDLAGRLPCALAGRPVVSLGVALPGVPSVTAACEPALRALMEHMTRDPARRRFAFLRGFANDVVTQLREDVFRQVLTEKGIEVDERLVVEVRYSGADALNAIEALLRDGLDFDAVVAANDAMAVSAVLALQRHGLSVPTDVIVSGFGDEATAIELQPPLTTVRQHIDRQVIAATELVLGALDSGLPLASDTHRKVAAQLVIRESSLHQGEFLPEQRALASTMRSSEPAAWLRRLLKDWFEALIPPRGIDVDELIDAIIATVYGGTNTLSRVAKLAFERTPPAACDSHWITHLARQLTFLARHLPLEQRHAGISSDLSLAAARLERIKRSVQARDRLERSAHRQLHESLLLRLSGCSSHEAIRSALHEGLDALGVERAWVLLYEDIGAPDAPLTSHARLFFAHDDPSRDDSDEYSAPGNILPPRLGAELERGTLLLSPLATAELQLGYLLLDPGELISLELMAITTSVALALRQVRQTSDLERRAEELHEANSALSVMARYDSLTGLPNRVLFHENLEAAFAQARERGKELALLFIDLDGFKLINDTLGHGAGDRLLEVVAARIRGVLGSGDSLARLGGDEFTIIALDGSAEAAERIAGDVLESVARPYRLDERVVNVTASVGIARYPSDGEETETLIRNADTAMYHAKACGKSRHAAYRPALNSEALVKLELQDALRRALAQEEFRLCYQPRVNLEDGRLTGFEALIRWRRDGRDGQPLDEIGPARFIPMAEQCGLIGSIDAFSLDESCRQARSWQEAGCTAAMSVNLSVKRLQESDIVEQIERTLRRHRLDPSLLELEITESAVMGDVDETISKLAALRALGVQIAIDDFGTGYSSLSYLRRLPVTTLKVDRSFLSSIDTAADTHSADAAIVRTVMTLGRSLGFRVVAEGVENPAQLAFLREFGCDEGQGFHFGRPLEVGMATERLRRDRGVPSA